MSGGFHRTGRRRATGWLIGLVGGLLLIAPALAADPHKLGRTAYRKANCIGCHKWHGGGGGGYGGVAMSLRASQLDRDSMTLVVRCGRPGSDMPYHDRGAWRGDSTDCYGVSAADLGDAAPPRAPRPLSAREIVAVVEFVRQTIQGRGPPDHADCVAFWGAQATRCKRMAGRAANN